MSFFDLLSQPFGSPSTNPLTPGAPTFGGGAPARAGNVMPNSPHTGMKMQHQGYATPYFENQQPAPQVPPQVAALQAYQAQQQSQPGRPNVMFSQPQGNPQNQLPAGVDPQAVAADPAGYAKWNQARMASLSDPRYSQQTADPQQFQANLAQQQYQLASQMQPAQTMLQNLPAFRGLQQTANFAAQQNPQNAVPQNVPPQVQALANYNQGQRIGYPMPMAR